MTFKPLGQILDLKMSLDRYFRDVKPRLNEYPPESYFYMTLEQIFEICDEVWHRGERVLKTLKIELRYWWTTLYEFDKILKESHSASMRITYLEIATPIEFTHTQIHMHTETLYSSEFGGEIRGTQGLDLKIWHMTYFSSTS